MSEYPTNLFLFSIIQFLCTWITLSINSTSLKHFFYLGANSSSSVCVRVHAPVFFASRNTGISILHLKSTPINNGSTNGLVHLACLNLPSLCLSNRNTLQTANCHHQHDVIIQLLVQIWSIILSNRDMSRDSPHKHSLLLSSSRAVAMMADGNDNMSQVRHVVLVLSGKGGVGKSTLTAELALALRNAGKKVGVLDVDLCGPSIPRMLGVGRPQVHQCDAGWVPVYTDARQTLALMSIGFLLEDPDDAVVWRGPKKSALIGQFVSDVAWGELDVLLVDTPPGTSDEHISVLESLRRHGAERGAVLVTTPQAVSTGDVRREIAFCKKADVRVLGVVENMSGFACPHCSECSNVFSKGGGEELAKLTGCPFLGRVPLDPLLSASIEEGKDFIQAFPDTATSAALGGICQTLLRSLEAA